MKLYLLLDFNKLQTFNEIPNNNNNNNTKRNRNY